MTLTWLASAGLTIAMTLDRWAGAAPQTRLPRASLADATAFAAKEASDESRDPTAGEIISKEKKGSINRVFPEQMRGKTLDEIKKLAGQGDAAAKTAKKLLTDKRFNKD